MCIRDSCPVCATTLTGCTGKEPTPTPTEQPEEPKEKGGNPGAVLALVLFVPVSYTHLINQGSQQEQAARAIHIPPQNDDFNSIRTEYSDMLKSQLVDGIDYALRVLQKDIKFTYQRDDENQIIYIE